MFPSVSESSRQPRSVLKSTETYHGQAMELSGPTPFPFWGPKLLGWLPLRRGGCVKVLPPSIPPTAREIPSAISSYGPKNKPSTPPTAEIFWHPLHLFGLKEEDMEKEGEGLTSTSSNSLLQEDSFSTNSFHSFLFLLSLQKVERL